MNRINPIPSREGRLKPGVMVIQMSLRDIFRLCGFPFPGSELPRYSQQSLRDLILHQQEFDISYKNFTLRTANESVPSETIENSPVVSTAGRINHRKPQSRSVETVEKINPKYIFHHKGYYISSKIQDIPL